MEPSLPISRPRTNFRTSQNLKNESSNPEAKEHPGFFSASSKTKCQTDHKNSSSFSIDRYFDDSSDEEDHVKRAKDYSSTEALKAFQENSKKDSTINKISEEDDIFKLNLEKSFLLHEVGIKMLYSDEVNKKYYKLKREHLNQFEITQNQLSELMRIVLHQTLNSVIETIVKIFCHSCFRVLDKGEKILVSEKVKDTFYSQVITRMNDTINECVNELISCRNMLTVKGFDELDEKSKSILQNYLAQLKTVFYQITDQLGLKYIDPYPFTEVDFEALPESAKHILNCYANQIALEELQRLGWLIKKDKDKDILITPAKIKHGSRSVARPLERSLGTYYTKLVEESYRHLSPRKAKSEAKKILENLQFTHELTRCYLEDIISYSKNREISPVPGLTAWVLWQDTQSNKEDLGIIKFFPMSDEIFNKFVNDLFLDNFFKQLKSQIDELKILNIKRKTFDRSHEFHISLGFWDLLSNLRLSNRSQNRTIKNLKNDPLLKLLNSDSSQSKKEKAHRNWVFNNHGVAIESQQINLSSHGREDWVDNAGSYQSIYSKINKFKQYFNHVYPNLGIKDADFAIWIRQIANAQPLSKVDTNECHLEVSERESLKEFLVGLTYLLLGCEVTRNPASLPIHQMMLDLIIAGGLTWEDAFTNNNVESKEIKGGRMPMSPDGAIAAGRKLHSIFNSYLLHYYSYDGTNKTAKEYTIKDMIERESYILDGWWKYIIKGSSLANIEDIKRKIEQSMKGWIGKEDEKPHSPIEKLINKTQNLALNE
jgi:hypothetical protein